MLGTMLGCGGAIDPDDPPDRLAAYRLFAGDPRLQVPAEGVLPYQLNTPLFTDYADKHRFVRLPEGSRATYRTEGVFEFPVGTVIAKTFGYPSGAVDDSGRSLIDLIETRILLRGEEGWVALPYLWNEAQTDARLDVTGGRADVRLAMDVGSLEAGHAIDYRVPNQNQCKGCHRVSDRELQPIGPRAGLLNGPDPISGANQIGLWSDLGALEGVPPADTVPRWPVWDDPSTGSLDHRARAWLDINCAHCHNPEGPARTSGLDLRFEQQDPTLWGVDKSPVAAGRGSGNRLVDIAPGDPDGSILLYRLESVDPGEMMPELGRSMPHPESIALIREWIVSLAAPPSAAPSG